MIDSVKLVIEADGETRTIIVPPGSVRQATLSEGNEPLYPVDSWPPPRTAREWDELVSVIELRVQAKNYIVATSPPYEPETQWAVRDSDTGKIKPKTDEHSARVHVEYTGEVVMKSTVFRTPWEPA